MDKSFTSVTRPLHSRVIADLLEGEACEERRLCALAQGHSEQGEEFLTLIEEENFNDFMQDVLAHLKGDFALVNLNPQKRQFITTVLDFEEYLENTSTAPRARNLQDGAVKQMFTLYNEITDDLNNLLEVEDRGSVGFDIVYSYAHLQVLQKMLIEGIGYEQWKSQIISVQPSLLEREATIISVLDSLLKQEMGEEPFSDIRRKVLHLLKEIYESSELSLGQLGFKNNLDAMLEKGNSLPGESSAEIFFLDGAVKEEIARQDLMDKLSYARAHGGVEDINSIKMEMAFRDVQGLILNELAARWGKENLGDRGDHLDRRSL